MEPSKERIFYLRDKNHFPVACVASSVENNVLHYGVSTHNPLDVYNKPLARKMALIRLHSKELPEKFGGMVECQDPKQAKQALLNAINKNTKVAQRARDAAKLWLKHQQEKAEFEFEPKLPDSFTQKSA